MTKDVTISIRGLQDYEESEQDTIELITVGKLRSTAKGFHLSYAESEMTGMEGTITSFGILPKKIILQRSGAVCSEMVFELGRQHLSLYKTPYGMMEVGVNTKMLRSTMTESGGELEVRFSIDIDHQLAGENAFLIRVSETKAPQV